MESLAGHESPLKICPVVKQAAYYCKSAIVSRTYFPGETTNFETKTSSGWLKRAFRGVREVSTLHAFPRPTKPKEREIALQTHYAVWRQCNSIISQIGFLFDIIIAVERVRDSSLKRIDEDYKKVQVIYSSLAQEDMRFPKEPNLHRAWELKFVHTSAVLFVKESYVSRQAIIHTAIPLQEEHKHKGKTFDSAIDKATLSRLYALRTITPLDLLILTSYLDKPLLGMSDVLPAFVSHEDVSEQERQPVEFVKLSPP